MAALVEMEQDAYLSVLLCLATQALDWGKEQLLGDLRQVLNISMDDHKRHLDAALADPRVQAIKRGDEDVPVSFAGRPIQRPRPSSPGAGLPRTLSQRGRPGNIRSIKRPFDEELPLESPFLQTHQSLASDDADEGRRGSLAASRGRGRGRMRRVSNMDTFMSTAPPELPGLASGHTASGLPLAQHLPVIRPLMENYLHSGDVALLEGTLQRLNARELQLQEELSTARRLQDTFSNELELRALQMQDLEAAERRKRNELTDQRAVITMNEV